MNETGQASTPSAQVASSPEAIAEAIAKAREAQRSWSARPLARRIKGLKRVGRLFLEQAEAIVSLLDEEVGRPPAESWLSEIIPNSDLFNYWTGEGARHLRRERVPLNPINFPKKTAFIERRPRGVVGLITPWNLPVALPLRGLLPALLAGNAVVFKPSEITPRSGAYLARLFAEGLSEFEEGAQLVQLVRGAGEVGAALVAGALDLVLFTGSVETGRKVAVACAERFIPCSLELGGKDAAIVLADAQLDRAAAALTWGACFNAGQNCASVERIYVERTVAAEFRALLEAKFKALVPDQDFGPMITAAQARKVDEQLQAARAAGVEAVEGQALEAGDRSCRPQLIFSQDDTLAVAREESFGPVVFVREVEDAEEAIRLANDSPYGLGASVWTQDLARGWALGDRLEVGVLCVNNHNFTGGVPSLPWGGVKETGGGITNSHHALEKLTRVQTVVLDRAKAPDLWWYPYNGALLTIAQSLRALALGKLGAVPKLLKALAKRNT